MAKTSLLDRARRLIRQALTENLRLKALAGFITIITFIVVRGGQEETARLIVEVRALPPSDTSDRVLMTEIPETVRLRVRGSPRVVQLVSGEEIQMQTLDLRAESDGPFAIDDPSLFRLPPGLEIDSINPATISLQYERRIRQQIQVLPVVSGQVVDGYYVDDPVVTEPSTITLSGPRSVIRQQQGIRTDSFSVEGLGPGQHRRVVLLEPAPTKCRYEGTDQVTLLLDVEPELVERTIENVVVEVRGGTLPARAEPITVVVRGVPDLISGISAEDLTAFVELGAEEAAPGNYRKDVQISGLNGDVTVTLDPSTVIVQVQRAPPLSQTGQGNAATPPTSAANTR